MSIQKRSASNRIILNQDTKGGKTKMPFMNPLNYLFAIEKVPENLKHGQSFGTFLNPLFVSYTITVKPELVERKRDQTSGTLIFDIKNESQMPLMNYSSNTIHYLQGVKVREVQIDAPFLAPSGGDNIRQSWSSKIVGLRRPTALTYRIKGYVKGVGFGCKIDVARGVRVKLV